MLADLSSFIGVERRLDAVSHAIRSHVVELGAPAVGAHQINCSEESERECVDAFHSIVVRNLLPDLKFWSRSSFRTVNLGGRYEWSSLGLAEQHYAIPETEEAFKVIVVKVNSHVSMVEVDGQPVFGKMHRYERESVYCGALHALLDGTGTSNESEPDPFFLGELHSLFHTGSMDRLAVLRDPTRVPATQRALFAALVNARLQAMMAALDAQQHRSTTPTVYLILPAVTLNREDPDTEILVGIGCIDERPLAEGGKKQVRYEGLGDDPSRYRVERPLGRLAVREE
jgi:hypothetical protein